MKIKDRLIGAVFGEMIELKVAERIKAASVLDAPNIGQDAQWRRLTTSVTRDLLPIEQDRMIEIAAWLIQTNPLAGWLIELTTAFIVAEGLPFEAKNDDVKGVLEGCWYDSVNRLPLNFPKFIDSKRTFGELCLTTFTAEQTGRVRYGYIDPAQIKDVITDPQNVLVPIGVLTKGWIGEIGGYSITTTPKAYRIILPEGADYVLSPQAQALRDQFIDGDCHYWSVNNLPNSPRGRSDLLTVSDWLDAYEQFLFDYADKWPQLNAFVWDMLVTGGDEVSIKKQLEQFSKKSGSVFAHNEKVTLEAVAPELKAIEADTGARLFRNHILGRFGFPEHWFGGGGDINRATAAEMDTPALKIMSRKQLSVKYVLEDMFAYQILKARAAGYLRVSDEEAGQYSVTTPEMGSKDIAKLSTAAQQVATSLVTAELQGWIDKDTARKIWSSIVSFTGVDIDLNEIKDAIEKEAAEKGYEDYKDREADLVKREAQNSKTDLKVVDGAQK